MNFLNKKPDESELIICAQIIDAGTNRNKMSTTKRILAFLINRAFIKITLFHMYLS